MCQSYRKACACGQQTSEIFFGKMVLDEKSIAQVYCPECSRDVDTESNNRVWDNGWVLELNLDVVRTPATMLPETSSGQAGQAGEAGGESRSHSGRSDGSA